MHVSLIKYRLCRQKFWIDFAVENDIHQTFGIWILSTSSFCNLYLHKYVENNRHYFCKIIFSQNSL